MNTVRLWNGMKYVATGMILLQIGGCTTEQFLEFLQTVLLGITAAGSYAILRNI